MTKLTFKETQFLKLITDNVRFMEKLERAPKKVKRPGEMIYVSMNKLSDQDNIKDIKGIDVLESLLALPKELIENDKFRFKLTFVGLDYSDNRVVKFLNCPLISKDSLKLEGEEAELCSVKIEYKMSYDAAGEENQRKWDKQNKK